MSGFGPEIEVGIARLRAEIAALHSELTRYGLVVWTGGNISGRVSGADLFVIKPSGVSYDQLAPENMILCDLDGDVIPDTPGAARAPSVDTAAHAHIYRELPEVGGIVHTHSPYAAAWAALGEPIPCIASTTLQEFGGDIPVGPDAPTRATAEIGRGVVETLRGHASPSVLMPGHGPFSLGPDARSAVKAAVLLEDAARVAHLARQLGEPRRYGAPAGTTRAGAPRTSPRTTSRSEKHPPEPPKPKQTTKSLTTTRKETQ
ncbi:L-ribulose-5-phosphate 4-epimerase [Herbiconiux moechotypicola]|uniref:L-ribulose-5-phosphate 4-epimerase n=1 Tax=Herbiconiux moechotypicola TaxID=637393 RepID=A0ABN3DQC2_9MICO|nr:L-ribulose-5-phosphate 4-epimerase [Herbiconiux moechotypicola]MCS5731409.1 L-ribulose-5-phosphate 4-epimerase [Herbiconiux moechotypicola]